MARDGRAGLRLGDRLLLFVAWLVTCGLVYLLGVYVGRGTREHPVGVADRIVRLPVTSTPPPQGQRPKGESDLTFYESLGAGERSAPAAPPAPHPPPPSPAPAPPAAAPRPPVPVSPAPAASAAAGALPTPAPSVAAAPLGTPAIPPPRAAPAPAPPAAPPRTAATPHPAAPVASPPTTIPPPPRTPAAPPPTGGGWTVLAGPTRDRAEAEGLQRQLHARGYDATLVRIARDGETWYRVQVGRFATATQANETMQRLRSDGVTHAFVASE